MRAQTTDSFPYERDWGTYYGPYTTTSADAVLDYQNNLYLISGVDAEGIESAAETYVTPGAYQTEYGGGGKDVLLSKFDSNGNLIWSTFYGGEGTDTPVAMGIDNNGNLYITGYTNSSTGIASTGSYQEYLGIQEEIIIPIYTASFIAKFSENGILLWATYYDGERMDAVGDISVDSNEIVIVGTTNSATNIATTNSFQENAVFEDQTNDRIGFIAKFNDMGLRLWATYYGTDTSISLGSPTYTDIDFMGEIIVVGATDDTSGYYATSEAYQPQNNGATDLFISKFSSSGNRLWSTYYGGEAEEKVFAGLFDIVATRNNLYFTANSESTTNISTVGTYQENLIGDSSPILVKFDAMTGDLLWGTYFGTTVVGQYATFSAQLDLNLETNELWISGSTTAPTNISTPGAYQETLNPFSSGSNKDGYFAKFSENGNLAFASYYGGDERDNIINVLPGNNEDNFYLVGTTSSPNAIATSDGYQPQLPAGNNPTNAFLTKFVPEGMGVKDSSVFSWSLWPNPTSGQFVIQGTNLGKMQLSLYDLNGRKLFSQNNVKVGQPINLRGKLSAGMYFLKVETDQQKNQVLKLIVK